MTEWTFKAGNILDEPSDVLVCSANGALNLSGGVGADLLGRYGNTMQAAIHQIVAQRSPRWIPHGEVVPYSGPELPWKAVLHAVAVDAWYDSSIELITRIVRHCLNRAAETYHARKVTLTALATGFGKLEEADFAEGIRPLMVNDFPPVEEVCVVMMEGYRLTRLTDALAAKNVESP